MASNSSEAALTRGFSPELQVLTEVCCATYGMELRIPPVPDTATGRKEEGRSGAGLGSPMFRKTV